MPLRDLPMEVWARIATFLPFEELVRTFRSLAVARALPDTRTTASNALLQFCSEACGPEEEASRHYELTEDMRAILVEMGFDANLVDRATQLCRGHEEAVFDYLLRRTDES